MNFKWVSPIALLAALVIGDQIRINRPDPFEIHLVLAEISPAHASLGTPDTPASNRRAAHRLIPAAFSRKTGAGIFCGKESP